MVFNTKNVKQIKRKNNWHLYLKLVDSLVKPVILYACECWSDSQRKDIFVNRTEQFHIPFARTWQNTTKSRYRNKNVINRYLSKSFKEEVLNKKRLGSRF